MYRQTTSLRWQVLPIRSVKVDANDVADVEIATWLNTWKKNPDHYKELTNF